MRLLSKADATDVSDEFCARLNAGQTGGAKCSGVFLIRFPRTDDLVVVAMDDVVVPDLHAGPRDVASCLRTVFLLVFCLSVLDSPMEGDGWVKRSSMRE